MPENHGCPNLFPPNHWSRRVKDQLWRDYGPPADRDKFTYGHDRNSNRTSKDLTLTTGKDEKYTYDNLNRLTAYDRGMLSGGNITSRPVRNGNLGASRLDRTA